MSDAVKKSNWFVRGWNGFWGAISFVFVQLWAFVTTEGKTVKEWSLDPWKVSALVCFGVAVWLAIQTVQFVQQGKSDASVGVIGGLVVTIGGFGTFLFNQAKSNDASIRSQGSGS